MKQKNDAGIVLKWIIQTIGKRKVLVVCLVILQSLLGSINIAYAFVLRRLINAAAAQDQHAFFIIIGVLVGVFAIQIGLQAISRYLNEYTAATIENQFKAKLFSSLMAVEYASVSGVHSGEWVNRLTSDTVVVGTGVTRIVPGFIGMMVRLFGALAAIVWLLPEFLYLLVFGSAAILAITYFFRKPLRQLYKRIREADGILRVFLQEHLESMLLIRAFSKEKETSKQAEALMENHKKARLKRNRFANFCNAAFSGMMKGFYALGIGYCGYGILTGTVSYGNMMAIMQLIAQVQNPFANMTGYLPKYYAMIASAERLMEAETFSRDCETKMTQEQAISFYQSDFQSLQLDHGCFAYPSSDQTKRAETVKPFVLEDVNLEIPKGSFIVFTGPSGCGKSTVLKLLMCLYPLDSGERWIQTAQGKEQLTSFYRNLFAYVPQSNQLLSGTIREIVSFGDEKRAQDDAAIVHALTIACADEFVMALDQGLDTAIGERGLGLSEGQMQRIAIARAIFSERPILILDEATSALDEATALRVLDHLHNMTDQTVIMVTHRLDHMSVFDIQYAFSDNGIQKKELNSNETNERVEPKS